MIISYHKDRENTHTQTHKKEEGDIDPVSEKALISRVLFPVWEGESLKFLFILLLLYFLFIYESYNVMPRRSKEGVLDSVGYYVAQKKTSPHPLLLSTIPPAENISR